MQGIRRLLQSAKLYSGRIVELTVDQVEMENGFRTVREVVGHPGGAVALALDPEGKLLFVRQPRYPIDRQLLELPAGKLDLGEDPAETVKRELEEETGYVAAKWRLLSVFYTSPGFCNERLHLFLAEDLTLGPLKPEQDEMISVESYFPQEALDMVYKGMIQDAKTIIGIFWAQQFLGSQGTREGSSVSRSGG